MQHVMTEPQDGDRIEIAPGDELLVRLEQQSGGGYLWSIAEVPAFLTEGQAEVEPVDRALPGQARTLALGVRATAQGTGELVLTLRRPWESEPAEQRVVHVDVR
ncbi:MAG: protease inhibitor I42 family protein [Intrasporangium sp.]|uniref:protease inhibitor I42 family protein n=1 Tax=Intrasporangium sp. TaxID=1925024 RepID=UPI00264902F7|nr:protease inhibitor I42 family protein [Intrasporangium sp.]MDN5798223.1 protease inhibitor I42 family protein [Intrasporangium sp.]